MSQRFETSKNGCKVVITQGEDKKLWIQLSGRVNQNAIRAMNELNYSTFDPTWVMKQILKTL